MSLEGAIAAHRFGLGARRGELDAASASPTDWLLKQLEGPADQPQPVGGNRPLGTGAALLSEVDQYRQFRKARKLNKTGSTGGAAPAVEMDAADRKDQLAREIAARFALGFTTERPFAEHLVWFWSNHFTVSSSTKGAIPFLGAFEREAIRPHITGKFEDMLLASTRHPAMLIYLNNTRSVGPNSMGGRSSRKGLNENLGREIMELHTLGVDGGYTQADVIAMAKILTGWSKDKDGGSSAFRFYPAHHEPGPIVLRGKTYTGGEEAGVAALKDLAHDPATARHIARKFAAYFIADDPPPDSVARLEKAFSASGGDLRILAETIVADPNAWKPHAAKMRTPVEYTTAAIRLLGWPEGRDKDADARSVMAAAKMMGEFPFAAPSPKGWPDDSSAWSGADALLNRIEWAKEIAGRMPSGANATTLAEDGLGPLLSARTRSAIESCPNPGEAVALLVSSPEFQRR